MQAGGLLEVGHFAVQEKPTPLLASIDVLFRVGAACLCGNDSYLLRGEILGRRLAILACPAEVKVLVIR